jgi:hypothetical protein
MRRSSIDREEKRVTRRNETTQTQEKDETDQLDTNHPNQRRLLELRETPVTFGAATIS